MKKIIILVLIFLFSCDEANQDEAPYIFEPIENITVFANSEDIVLDLSLTFTDDDNDDSQIHLSIIENTNPNLIELELDTINKRLTIMLVQDQTGISRVKIEAESNGKSVVAAFSVTVNEIPDVAPRVVNPVSDLTFIEGVDDTTVNVGNVFTDDDGDVITITVSNTNTALLTTSISNNVVTITMNLGQSGTANVTLTATANGLTATDVFAVNVQSNPSDDGVENGGDDYSNGDYADAEASFLEAIQYGDQRYIEVAYVGLSFSQLAQGTSRHEDAYESLMTGLDLAQDEYEDDFNAGLAFLNVAYTQNYTGAIANALAVLNSNPGWSMAFNDNINFNDVRLTLAQAYYHNQDFSACLVQVKVLDNEFNLEEDDPNFLSLLADKLSSLADQFRD